MGRNFALGLISVVLTGCLTPIESETFSKCKEADILLMPHHLLVEEIIKEFYEAVDPPDRVIIVSPDHFYLGKTPISRSSEEEHGFTIHRDFVQQYFPHAEVEAWRIQPGTAQTELVDFVTQLNQEDALFIFSIDFSHYLPGKIAHVHDLRSQDVIEARSIVDATTLEVDSPESIEVMLRLSEKRELSFGVLKNTNPSLDTGYETFENTTHLFGCSQAGAPVSRAIHTQMSFAHPYEWYLGKTTEDRYLYGYDEVFFDQGGKDIAIIQEIGKPDQVAIFDYFD